jgi:hypothetical protein
MSILNNPSRHIDVDQQSHPRRLPVTGAAARVAVAAGAAFVTSAAWYTGFAEPYASLLGDRATAGPSPTATAVVELGRSLVVSAALAAILRRLDIQRVRDALSVAMLAWAAFPATLMIGSVIHDGVPVALAAIHAGDWLVKLSVVATVLVKLRGRDQR